MEDLKLDRILRRAISSNVSKQEILDSIASFKAQVNVVPLRPGRCLARKVSNMVLLALYRGLPCLLILLYFFQRVKSLWLEEPCLVPRIVPYGEATLPVADCDICANLRHVPVVDNITVASFLSEYAYSSRPVLMKGAAKDWPATRLFSYEYFRQLYSQNQEAILRDSDEGQFFAYSSNVRSLNEFMNMNDDRASMKTETWYIGWSSSDQLIGKELRKHVREPYFLPPGLSEPTIAWIFMGAPGPGAGLHIDFVSFPSWQAQLQGTKTWTLIPPPECEHLCLSHNITVHMGDIIVVDTNWWYHGTLIHPGNISITYGTEFK